MTFIAVVVGITGHAHAIREDGSKIDLIPGAQLAISDTIITGNGASLRVVFQDKAEISLGEQTRIEIRDFAYDPTGQEDPAFWVHMATGLVRSISGKIVEQNPESFKLSSPLGVAGIRGTTTLHEIHDKYEVHSVLELTNGHLVVITTHDGRSLVITDQLKLVRLYLDDHSQLFPEDLPDDELDKYLLQLLPLNRLRDGVSGLYFIGGIDALGSLGSLWWSGSGLSFLSASNLPLLERGLASIGVDFNTSLLLPPLISGLIPGAPWSPPSIVLPPGFNGLFLNGTNYNDTLSGGPNNDYIRGFRGDDYINAGRGQDTVFGGYGSYDTIIKPGLMDDGNYLYGDEEVMSGGAVGDDDIISVIADAVSGPGDMTGGVIYGDARLLNNASGGDDSITVEGSMRGGVIYGDAEEMHNGAAGGNDSIVIAAMSGGTVYADAGSGTYTGGNDTIRVGEFADGDTILLDGGGGKDHLIFADGTAHVIFNDGAFIFGANETHNTRTDAVHFNGIEVFEFGTGNNTITATGAEAKDCIIAAGLGASSISLGELETGKIIGDVLTFAPASLWDSCGNDTIHVGSMNGGAVIGDAEEQGYEGRAGHDTITIGTMSAGIVCGDAGLYNGYVNRAIAGNDSIAINTMTGGLVYGDYGSGTVLEAGNNTISIGTLHDGTVHGGSHGDSHADASNVIYVTDMYGGTVYGNAHTSQGTHMYGNSISIARMHDGLVAGNGYNAACTSSEANTISIGVLNGGTVYGNAEEFRSTFSFSDSIVIGEMNGGTVYGDGITLLSGSAGGDTYSITTLNDGTINARSGNDSVTIGTMTGGVLNVAGGSDTIHIGTFTGGTINGWSHNSVRIDVWNGGTIDFISDLYSNNTISIGEFTNPSGSLTMTNSPEHIILSQVSGGSYNLGGGYDTLTIEKILPGTTDVYVDGGDHNADLFDIGNGVHDVILTSDSLTFGSGETIHEKTATVHMNGFERFSFGEGNDTIYASALAANQQHTFYGDSYTSNANATAFHDKITVDSGSMIIYGDYETLAGGSGGNDTITVGEITGTSTIYGDATSIFDAVCGNDSITVTEALDLIIYGDGGGASVSPAMSVFDDIPPEEYKGTTFGNDTIRVGIANNVIIVGDAHSSLPSTYPEEYPGAFPPDHATLHYGNDSITVGTMSSRGYVYGDGSLVYSTGGDDTITVTDLSEGASIMGDGDLHASTGGNDLIQVDTISSHAYVYGDGSLMDSAGGNDTITINSMVDGVVAGDAEEMTLCWTLSPQALESRGGNDTIAIGAMASGTIVGDATGIWFDHIESVENTLSIHCGADSITVSSSDSGLISGDVEKISGSGGSAAHISVNCGADTLTIGTLNGATIYGDIGYIIEGWNIAAPFAITSAGDSITVTDMHDGSIIGDIGRIESETVTSVTLGADTIAVSTLYDGTISGDLDVVATYWETSPEQYTFGADSISVGTMNGGHISGDVNLFDNYWETSLGQYTFAADSISVGTINGGSIYGDAAAVQGEALPDLLCGDDTLTIDVFNGGSIYGDIGTLDASVLGGDDTISIGSVGGTALKEIFGGGGDDTFIFGKNICDTGVTVYIRDFLNGNDVLDLRAFGLGDVTQAVQGSDLHVTCVDNTSGNVMTLILDDIDQELTSLQFLLATS